MKWQNDKSYFNLFERTSEGKIGKALPVYKNFQEFD